jgi:hypothetical protein
MVGGVGGQVNESPEVGTIGKITVVRSRLDSLTRILANKRHKVVLTPGFDNNHIFMRRVSARIV